MHSYKQLRSECLLILAEYYGFKGKYFSKIFGIVDGEGVFNVVENDSFKEGGITYLKNDLVGAKYRKVA
jgi:hypothetical protein